MKEEILETYSSGNLSCVVFIHMDSLIELHKHMYIHTICCTYIYEYICTYTSIYIHMYKRDMDFHVELGT